jgi:hypothetical protein
MEEHVQENEDHTEDGGHDVGNPPAGSQLELVFARPSEGVSWWQMQFFF